MVSKEATLLPRVSCIRCGQPTWLIKHEQQSPDDRSRVKRYWLCCTVCTARTWLGMIAEPIRMPSPELVGMAI